MSKQHSSVTNAEKRVAKAAMHWYRTWSQQFAEPPTIDSGHDIGEVELFEACDQLAGLTNKRVKKA